MNEQLIGQRGIVAEPVIPLIFFEIAFVDVTQVEAMIQLVFGRNAVGDGLVTVELRLHRFRSAGKPPFEKRFFFICIFTAEVFQPIGGLGCIIQFLSPLKAFVLLIRKQRTFRHKPPQSPLVLQVSAFHHR